MTRKTHLMLNILTCFCILMIFVVISVSALIMQNGFTVFQSIWEGLLLIQLMSEIFIIAMIKRHLKNAKPQNK